MTKKTLKTTTVLVIVSLSMILLLSYQHDIGNATLPETFETVITPTNIQEFVSSGTGEQFFPFVLSLEDRSTLIKDIFASLIIDGLSFTTGTTALAVVNCSHVKILNTEFSNQGINLKVRDTTEVFLLQNVFNGPRNVVLINCSLLTIDLCHFTNYHTAISITNTQELFLTHTTGTNSVETFLAGIMIKNVSISNITVRTGTALDLLYITDLKVQDSQINAMVVQHSNLTVFNSTLDTLKVFESNIDLGSNIITCLQAVDNSVTTIQTNQIEFFAIDNITQLTLSNNILSNRISFLTRNLQYLQDAEITNNTIETGLPIIFLKDQSNSILNTPNGQLILVNLSSSIIDGLRFNHQYFESRDLIIFRAVDLIFRNSSFSSGMELLKSTNTTIHDCTFTQSTIGLYSTAINSTVFRNNFTTCETALVLEYASGDYYYNNFLAPVIDNGVVNNFTSNFYGIGVSAPYLLPGSASNRDLSPLPLPYLEHPPAVVNTTLPTTSVSGNISNTDNTLLYYLVFASLAFSGTLGALFMVRGIFK